MKVNDNNVCHQTRKRLSTKLYNPKSQIMQNEIEESNFSEFEKKEVDFKNKVYITSILT